MNDHRHILRPRTLKSGKIVFNHKSSVIDCTIRNLTDGGACLEVHSTVGIPDSFELMMPTAGPGRCCLVAWRTDRRLGVAFERPQT